MASAPPREAAVQVVVRLRPLAGESSENFTINAAENTIEVRNPKRTDRAVVNNAAESFSFVMNGVLNRASQAEAYDACARDIVEEALQGISGAILAYGQTGSGKTYTMSGPGNSFTERGIVPRAITQVFQASFN
jgi:kinesin family member 6/9